jgi:hypothetical protein
MINPKTKISDKAQLATDHYIANTIIAPIAGYSWARAMTEAAYSLTTVNKQAKLVWGYIGVQSQIDAARAKIGAKAEHNRDIAINLLTANLDRLQAKADDGDVQAAGAITAVIRELNAISALHSQTVNTQNKTLAIHVQCREGNTRPQEAAQSTLEGDRQ